MDEYKKQYLKLLANRLSERHNHRRAIFDEAMIKLMSEFDKVTICRKILGVKATYTLVCV